MLETPFVLRLAAIADAPALRHLIELSVRRLQAADYSPHQLDGALGSVFGVDTQLIADRTYFLVETSSFPTPIACGGWSVRRTLFGSDDDAGRDLAATTTLVVTIRC